MDEKNDWTVPKYRSYNDYYSCIDETLNRKTRSWKKRRQDRISRKKKLKKCRSGEWKDDTTYAKSGASQKLARDTNTAVEQCTLPKWLDVIVAWNSATIIWRKSENDIQKKPEGGILAGHWICDSCTIWEAQVVSSYGSVSKSLLRRGKEEYVALILWLLLNRFSIFSFIEFAVYYYSAGV